MSRFTPPIDDQHYDVEPVPARPDRGRRLLRRTLIVIGAFIGVIVVAIGGVKLADVALTARERAEHAAPGSLVDVDGHSMHVVVEGDGDHTIVLVPGLGTSSPVFDFEPLTEALSEHSRVAVVEPFGYGWSDSTDREMTAVNVAHDIHAALVGADVPGPYVIAAHSIGGLYAQQFADLYPEDTAAVVGIDPTMPRTFDFAPATEGGVDPFAAPIPEYFGWATAMGWTRILQGVVGDDPQLTSGASSADGYSRANLEMQRTLTNWSAMSSNVMDQAGRLAETIGEVENLRFSERTPVLLFTAQSEHGDDAEWLTRARDDYLASSGCAATVGVDAGHYLHHTASSTLATEIQHFLDRCVAPA
ncbi:hypothetical protein DCE93_07370 [Agromyces badenianii]|uniref:Uncharacterized protein n=1 Tax=Agromyces badenianii TaxID=2080742 RepID=A0A2S0WW08_9MICO|nr:alpha/beta hydrolase [Agromyces badenianii]AWB95502.1 hypothetical protein DCE93_07370 [Agromyces badenianii]PWC04210.1 alpha/beta hydrolase [Agromyces badenianii]